MLDPEILKRQASVTSCCIYARGALQFAFVLFDAECRGVRAAEANWRLIDEARTLCVKTPRINSRGDDASVRGICNPG